MMPRTSSKKFSKLSASVKDVESKSARRLPNWVDLSTRGIFKDEIKPADAEDAVSWLASWKPSLNPVNLSYIKQMNEYEEEYVCKSKNWMAAKNRPYPKMRCVICKRKYLFPSYVNFCYKYDDSLKVEQISEKQKVACSYHFMMKGVNKGRTLHKSKGSYREEEDFDENEFGVDYDEFMEEKKQMDGKINDLTDSVQAMNS